MQINPYPLQFKPEMKERVWGGRTLERFGLTLPDGPIGEGWMIADHPNGTTSILNGELAGKGLDEIRELFGALFLGTKGYSGTGCRFPLLIKLLDCNDDLSIQVHPGDDYKGLPPGEPGKTEMWYILDAKPGAKIIYGLKEGIDRAALEAAISGHRILDTLQEVPVKAGDAFYIPSGTVHALCAGVVVAEIQQNSDTTYRLFDYNRPGTDGKLRELHIEDSLVVATYGSSAAKRMSTDDMLPGEWLTIAKSPYFIVEKGIIDGRSDMTTTAESFVILVIAEGTGTLHWNGGRMDVKRGECFLLPANLGLYQLQGSLTVIRSHLP
jgi:mannose-6-phosphate isomerase